MPFTLTAVNCPPNPSFSGLYDVTSGPITSQSFADGDTTTVRPNLNENAARCDLVARYGGGGYAIVSGLAISDGGGLILSIAAGHAWIDGLVAYAGGAVTLSDGGRNWVWISRAGAITVVFNSTTPPTGAFALLGSAVTTGAGVIASVDQSGVMYLIGGMLQRRTADATTPGDTPSANLRFLHRGTAKMWLWDGAQYWEISQGATSTPLSVANGGTGAATAAGARTNLAAAAVIQVVIQPSTSFTLSTAQTQASQIELRTGGGIAAIFTVTVPSADAVAGQEWVFHNTTGYACRITYQGGSAYVYMGNGQTTHVYFDGSEVRESGRNAPRYDGATISGTVTRSQFEEVEADVWAFGPSAGNATIEWPTAGALGNKGRRQVIRNDDSGTLILTARTTGGTADSDTVLLPGEARSHYINNSGGLQADNTRPHTRLVTINFGSDANKTAAHPDFLAVFIATTSSGSLTATRDLVMPLCSHKEWFVYNGTTGGQSIRVIGASGTGVTIRNGKGAWVRCDGTNYLLGEERAITTASSEEVAATTTSTATVANTGTETTLLGTVIGSATLPASVLQPGRSLRFKARGYFSTIGSPGTLNLKFKFGSTSIVATGAQTPTGSLTNRFWEVDVILTCRATGGSGTVFAQGIFTYMAAAQGAPTCWEMLSTATVTIDTTATQAVDLTATWGTADPGNTISCSNCSIEVLN